MAKKTNTLIWVGLGTVVAGGLGWYLFKLSKDQDPKLPVQAAKVPSSRVSQMFPPNTTPIQTALSRRVPVELPPLLKDPKRAVTYLPTDTHEQRKLKKRRLMLQRKKEAKKRAMEARGRKKVVIPVG